MSGKNIIFNNNKIYKSNFYKSKKLCKIDSLDVNKILLSKKEPKLPQMTGYNKYFESNNKAMFLNVIYEKLLK